MFLVNIWIVQSCYFVHCLHLPRCLYYTQCNHSMSSFSPLPYLHCLLRHLHRCIIFLFIFRTVLAFIIIVLTSITAINAIAKVFASIYMFFIFITVSFFSSSVFLLIFFILMGVVLIFIIVSIILEVTSCSCLHKFIHFTHLINFSFFSSSVFLLLFFITVFIRMGVVLISIIISIILEVSPFSCLHKFIHFTHIQQFLHFLFFCLPSPLLHQCLHTVFIFISIVLIFITFFIILVNVSPCLQTCLHYIHPSKTGRLPEQF